MRLSDKEYQALADRLAPRSPIVEDCLNAFWIGGLICTVGQFLTNGYLALGVEKPEAQTLTSVTLVFLSAMLTGLALYDNIAKHAGAGTLVPITGFANAVAAPAVEFKTEGFVTGLAVKMFSIAGPVLVYGLAAGTVYGVILWLFTLF